MGKKSKSARYTLTSLQDVEKLPFGDGLKKEVRDWFDEISKSVPQDVLVKQVDEVVKGTKVDCHWKGNFVVLTMGIKKEEIVQTEDTFQIKAVRPSIKGVSKRSFGTYHCLVEGEPMCIEIVWDLTIQNGRAHLSPRLMGKRQHGKDIDFSFLQKIHTNLQRQELGITENVVKISGSDVLWVLESEALSVIKKEMRKIAKKNGIPKVVLADQQIPVSTETMRMLLSFAGYDPAKFRIDEQELLSLALAMVTAEKAR